MKLKATDKNMSLLSRINTSVNETIKYVPDSIQFNKAEDWRDARATNKDDCDGFALTKYLELSEAGVPEECMAVCTCIAEIGGGHAVLIVSTDAGDFVLDNRYAEIKLYDSLPYNWMYVPENVTGKN